jgi:hypothetical protein
VYPSSAMRCFLRPNRPFNRKRYEKAASPPGAHVHHALVGQTALPPALVNSALMPRQ